MLDDSAVWKAMQGINMTRFNHPYAFPSALYFPSWTTKPETDTVSRVSTPACNKFIDAANNRLSRLMTVLQTQLIPVSTLKATLLYHHSACKEATHTMQAHRNCLPQSSNTHLTSIML
eukprot:1160674-Pelagomonas_calceolata.AAC.1